MIELNPDPPAHRRPLGPAAIRSGGIFDYDAKVERLEEVNRELENPDVWNDSATRAGAGPRALALEKTVNGIRELNEGLDGARELLELVEMEDDEETASAIVEDVERYARGVEQLEFTRMFSGRWIRTRPSSTSRPAPAAPRRRTGPKCCCACTCAGPNRAAGRPS